MRSRPRRFGWIAVAFALAAGVAVVLWQRGPTEPAPSIEPSEARSQEDDTRRVPRSDEDIAGHLARRSDAPLPPDGDDPLPRSLRGTEIDGWLGVDDEGHFVVTPGARWFFDYFLSATGEEADDRLRARIVDEIERRLPPPGAAEAVELLDRYLAYRERARRMQQSGPPMDLAERLDELHAIRVEVFGDANAAALFGEEEQVQAIDLERRKVLGDAELGPEERARRLEELERRLPAAIREAREQSLAALHLMRDEQQLREAGGSDDEVRALREQRFGADAAERLAALDAERVAWQRRIEDYRRARQAIADDRSLDDTARKRALAALIEQSFTPQERLRVQAFDQIRDPPEDGRVR